MQLGANVGSFLLASFFFGAFTVLIIFSTYTALTSNISLRTKLLKTGLTLTMYVIAASHLAGSIAMFSAEKDLATFTQMEQMLMILGVINYVLSDAVVVWRCWLLWKKKYWILMVPIVLFITMIVGAIVFVGLDIAALASFQKSKDRQDELGYLIRDDLVIWSLTLATNVWATAMVSFKAWKYRRHIKLMMSQGSKKTQLERLMALLTESGAFYCLIWIIFLIIYASTRTGSFVMDGVMVQISGIYPTILIVLVNFGKTPLQNDFSYNGDGLAVQRQNTIAPSPIEGSQTSHGRVFDLNRMFTPRSVDQIRASGEEGSGVRDSQASEISIIDRKEAGHIV